MSATAPPHRQPPLRHTRQVFAVLAGFLLVASAAVAAVLVTYSTSSTTALSLKDPPIQWSAGPDSSGNGFVASWSLSSNRTYYAVTLHPVPEANVTWQNLTTLTNTDSQAWNVQVSGTDLSSGYAKIVTFRLEFLNAAGSVVGALNLSAPGQNALGLGSMAAGQSYHVRSIIQLASGTGNQDLPAGGVGLSLTIS